MVLAGNLDVNSEHNYLSKTLKMNRTTNGEAEKGLRKQNDLVPRRSVDGRCGNSVIDGASARICFDEKCKETFVAGCSSSKPNANKVRQHGEMTLQDMYESQNLVDDDEDDSDWEPEEKHVEKRARQHREVTLQDMHDNPNLFDDDDDSDSDWEPLEKHVEVKRWFCTNCTMLNFDDIVHCEICGEHIESGILRHGFFASPLLPNALLTDLELDIKEKHKDETAQNPAPSRRTAIGFDERMLLHSEVEMKSYPHPERPDRIQAIAASLATAGIFPGRCYPIAAREITREELHMVHSLEHVEAIEHSSKSIASYFTPDTYANEHSACAARLAAGLCADLASAVVSGRVKNGFALVRPPGHHAGVAQAMGFCLHNNAAVAALAAQAAGAKKVLIVDWDVHHGNGTQEIFDNNKSVLYISLHRHEGGKFYPGTGAADEVGTMGAEGYCVNVPWSRRGIGDNDYVFAFQHVVLPIASEFAPDLTIISAGFDAARGDPLGCCDVTPTGYAKMTEMLNDISGGKLLVILEGGYNLRSISSSATAVIKVLLGESRECELENSLPSRSGLQTILDVLKIQMKYWPKLQPDFAKLQSQWEMFLLHNKRGKIKKQHRRHRAPLLWKYGRKSMLYRLLNGNVHVKRKCACQFC